MIGKAPHLRDRRVLQVAKFLEFFFFPELEIAERFFLRRTVRRPPLVVVRVPLKTRFRGLAFLVRFAEPGFVFRPVVPVARVVPTCALAVVAPVLKAHPAEVVLALRTSHVHAAARFFNRALALRARLGVRQDPGKVFGFGAVFNEPLVHRGARHRAVRVFLAPPAKRKPTRALHVHGARRSAARVGASLGNDGALAPRRDAPNRFGVVIHEAAPTEGVVLFQHRGVGGF